MKLSRRHAWLALAFPGCIACGGSASEDATKDPAKLIDDLCAKIADLGCDYPQTQCASDLHDEHDDAIERGCAAEFDALFGCRFDTIVACEQEGPDPCDSQHTAYRECLEANVPWQDGCAQSFGSSPGAPTGYDQCMLICPAWQLTCETKGTPTLECTCTKGPKIGTTFTLGSCPELTPELALPYCGG